MTNRATFFASIRSSVFGGSMTQDQVDGCEAILDEWERRKLTDLRWLAYILATTFWETARTMQPITEYGSQRYLRGKSYWPWIGRGYVQLTWERNYRAMTELLHAAGFDVDLTQDMDAALRPDVAAFVLFEGMIRGTFTGKKLSDYFGSRLTDWYNARRIVNGVDKAAEIATIGRQFHVALQNADTAPEPPRPAPDIPAPVKPDPPARAAGATAWNSFWTRLGEILKG